MELIQGINPLDKIIAANTGKKIGKYSIDYNKISDTEIKMHDGHKNCINQLHLAGMDIIILEFMNSSKIYKHVDYFGKIVPLVDQVKVLDNCIAENLDVDYVIYDSDDFKTDSDAATIQLVDDRLAIEDYKNKFKISEFMISQFRANLIFITRRNYTGITMARSYKTGTDGFAYKHYLNKYMNCDLINVHPIMSSNVNFPLSGSSTEIELNDDAKSFLDYFYKIEKSEIISNPDKVKTDLEQYIIGLGSTIVDFVILDDPAIVGVDKIFISAYLKGIYNTMIPANRWI